MKTVSGLIAILLLAFALGVATWMFVGTAEDSRLRARIGELEQNNKVLTSDVARTAAHGVATEINLIRCREGE